MTACPPDDQLRQLLAGELPDELAAALTRHADGCAACQGRLGQLSEEPTAGRWRRLLRPAGPDNDATKRLEPGQLASTLVAPPADAPAGEALLRRLRGERRGPLPPPAPPGYEVLGELGRGGMGVVYVARQTALKRLVALKVIGTGAWAGRDEVARFRAEAEAVARLQHPNIVQIYEIGEYEGRPFFSLEYVDGGSLDQRLDGTPLPPRAAAEVVRTLALAIHAAHERGVVHRDLKPANVLLAACGFAGPAKPQAAPLVPKIADFGLAKRLGGEPGMTQSGVIVGTPSYMAPEQALGRVHDIGPACDVYALGAILYECLTGRPPFNAATSLETLQQVQAQTPVPPRRLQPAVPRDVETICLKCLEKDPRKRYASARALADDLDRLLSGRPIQARPAGLLERAGKWAKRRPAVALSLATLTLAVSALAGTFVWSYVRISQEAERAKSQVHFAQDVLEDMYLNVADEWLTDEPAQGSVEREFLGKALKYYTELAKDDAREPDARQRTALAYFRMGQLHRVLNEHDQAERYFRQAIRLQEPLRDEFPDRPRYRQDLANSRNWLGELLRESEKSLEEAEQNFRQALALQERLAEEVPGEPEYRRELARSHSNLGLVEMDTGRPEAAARDYDRAVALLEQVARERPEADGADFRHELARTLTNRGVFHQENGRLPAAEADYRRAIDLLQDLRRTGRRRTLYAYNLAIAYHDMGNLYFSQHRYDDALAPLSEAEAILRRLAEDFPKRAHYRKKLAKTYNSMGSVLAKKGKPEEARKDWELARDLLGDLLRDDPNMAEYKADLGMCLGNLGWMRLEQDDRQGARACLEQAIEHLQEARRLKPKRLDFRQALRNQYRALAETLVQAGDRAAAVKAATALAEVFPDQAQGYYYAACFAARCVGLVKQETFADAAARRAAEEEQARQAAAFLRQALDKGLRGDERLVDEARLLRPLAERPEFDGLLRELSARPGPPAAKGGT